MSKGLIIFHGIISTALCIALLFSTFYFVVAMIYPSGNNIGAATSNILIMLVGFSLYFAVTEYLPWKLKPKADV